MFPHISLPEVLIIAFLAILFFGKDKLPDAAASFGKAFKSFKSELSSVQSSINLDEPAKTEEKVKVKKSAAKKSAKKSSAKKA
ncbi:MAG: twin-arginine translocase TatA/TatE family subunit [bacterium]